MSGKLALAEQASGQMRTLGDRAAAGKVAPLVFLEKERGNKNTQTIGPTSPFRGWPQMSSWKRKTTLHKQTFTQTRVQ